MVPRRARVIVAGDYAVALVMKCPRLPVAGETLLGSGFRTTHGGKGSNMAVQAARLGAQTEFIGVIGHDGFGQNFRDLLRQEGVGTLGLRETTDAPTGAGLIMTDPEGRNLISVDLGAANLFAPADIDAAADLFTAGSVVLMPLEIPLATALRAAAVGRQRGLTTILNPAPAQDMTAVSLADVDFFTPNENEAKICAGFAPDASVSLAQIAARLLGRGCRNVIVTRGEQGCSFFNSTERFDVQAFRVNAVDTTGAGDAFNAGLAVGLGEGLAIPAALRFACAAGALSVTKPDTVPSYHQRNDVQRLMD